MGLKPCFSVVANGNDITETIFNLCEYISLTDKTGYESDICEISLIDDPNNPIAMPAKGAELKVSMGYDGDLVDMGLYIVDEIELEGPPEKMIIRARASIQTESKSGKTSITSQKTRSWPKQTSIQSVVKKIAIEHDLTAMVSDTLKSVLLPHIDQSDESDISFLMRIAKRYDAICKPAGGKLLFVKRGEIELPTLELNRYQLSRWNMTLSSRESAGTVIAYWNERKKAKRNEIKVGDGEPVRRLKHSYPDAKSAQAGAQAALDQAKRGEEKLRISKVGDPIISAEMPLLITDVRDGINGNWIIEQVVHSIDKSTGYSCEIDAVKTLADDGDSDIED